MAKKRSRRRQQIPENESNVERFIRVVTPRVGKALKAIRQIAFCAASTYESTPKQQAEILKALDREFQSLKSAFEKKVTAEDGFKFPE